DSTLVLGTSLTNEGRVVNKTVLGGVTLSLQGSEQSLLGTENLDSGGRVLGKVGQRTGVGNKSGTNDLTDKLGKVGSNVMHLFAQVVVESLAVFGDLDNTLSKGSDVGHVSLRDILAHG